jgi:predicted Zn finger-like uncharacterized protein
MSDFDHTRTDQIVCPYCGHAFRDSSDIGSDSGKLECHECEKVFFFEREIDVNYSTVKLPPGCDKP